MEIDDKDIYVSKYEEYYRELENKYSRLIEEGSKIPINWYAKIAPKKSLIASEGICGGGPTRTPKYIEYKNHKKGWQGITFYIDRYMDGKNVTWADSPANVAIIMEPRHFRPWYYDFILDGGHALFQVILTHDSEILQKYPKKAVYCIAGAPIIEDSSIGMHLDKKNRLISTCYSHKGSSNNIGGVFCRNGDSQPATEGHLFRHEIARSIIGNDSIPEVDLYGSGSPNGPVALKSDSLVNHMFSIVVENGTSDMYFTEKIMDCFLTGNIPIYRGASEIGDFFDKRGIIEFNTVDELHYILKNKINEETYMSMLPYMKRNLELTKQYMYIDDIMLFLTLDHIEKGARISFDDLNKIKFGSGKVRIGRTL